MPKQPTKRHRKKVDMRNERTLFDVGIAQGEKQNHINQDYISCARNRGQWTS